MTNEKQQVLPSLFKKARFPMIVKLSFFIIILALLFEVTYKDKMTLKFSHIGISTQEI
jgi:hypothetical protein